MWLFNSSIGRKFIMALTGICLVLFVTFHVLMNAVAILWPAAYNQVCLFLGANWYALIASMGLGLLFVIHVIYALCLTLQNRKARGNDAYNVSRRPATVEWSSQNMLVLGIVVIAFLGVHLVQFWAKMQAQEVCGQWYTYGDTMIPAGAGTLFLQLAFEQVWTLPVYIIGFVALWFHMNHGFWSMWQSIGWNNATWLPRLKKVACWWTSIVVLLFIIQAVTFTVRANQKYYFTNGALQMQYQEMYQEHIEEAQEHLMSTELMPLQLELMQISREGGNPLANPRMMQLQQEVQAAQQQLQALQSANQDALINLLTLGQKNAQEEVVIPATEIEAAQPAEYYESTEVTEVEEDEAPAESNN